MKQPENTRAPRVNIWQREWFRGVLLAAIIALIWCSNHGRMSLDAWKVPIDYNHDSFLVMGWVKTAADGHYWPLVSKTVPSLGAPLGANWNDYPVTEDTLICCIGMLARVVGLFAACNLAVLFGQVLAGLSFYGVCRWLRYSWEWAFMGALLFAFSFYAACRFLPHIVLLYYWHIPLFLLVCWWFGSRRGLGFDGNRYWFALAVGMVTGLQNPYYTNLFLQFLGFAVLAQMIRRNSWQKIVAPVSVGAVTVLMFLLMNVDTFSYSHLHGKNPGAVTRNYASLEVYALKPLELLIPPPTHRLGEFRKLGRNYEHDSYVKGEMFASYLGVVGIGALFWLAALSAGRVIQQARKPVPVHAAQVGWIIFYSIIGGLNCILGIAGLTLFRGANRFSIAILALVLFFLVRQLTRLGSRLQPHYRIGLAVVIAVVGLWDQLPRRISSREISRMKEAIQSDREYAQALESSLPTNAAVFQLPVTDFPEYGSYKMMGDYEHLRPYLHTHGLRFSYGDDKGRPSGSWQREVEKMPPAQMIATLESYGFGAISINRKGYSDEATELIDDLKEAGGNVKTSGSSGDLVSVLLHPSIAPVLPKPGPAFVRGFYPEESNEAKKNTWHWSWGNANIELWNSSKTSSTVSLNFELLSQSSRKVEVFFENEKVLNIELYNAPRKIENLLISLKPGVNRLRFITDRPALPVDKSPDLRKLAFMLRNFSLEYAHPEAER